MLHIILAILKLIGLVLLSVLGLLLLIVLLVLFVPIRYAAEGERYEELWAKSRISWLLRIFSLQLSYEHQRLTVKLRLFGIPIWDLLEPKKKVKKQVKRTLRRVKKDAGAAAHRVEEQEALKDTQEQTSAEAKGTRQETEQAAFSQAKPHTVSQRPASASAKKSARGRRSPYARLKNWLRSVRQFFRGLFSAFRSFFRKLKYWREFLKEEDTRMALSLCKEQLGILWRHIRPRRLKGNLHFSTGDPAYTGQILGIISMLWSFYPDSLSICPDFESESPFVQGSLSFQGRITMYQLLLIALTLYRDKALRSTLKKLDI